MLGRLGSGGVEVFSSDAEESPWQESGVPLAPQGLVSTLCLENSRFKVPQSTP